MIKSVYLHIPFCKKKCNYCSFCSFELLKYKDEYVDSLVKEIKHFYKKEKLDTIYFGGGTPSLLEINDIKRILDNFNYDQKTEITLEINPDIEFEKLKEFKNLGINRISIGVQSFDDKILKKIGRSHNSAQAIKTIENVKKLYKNFSIDLMYGLPSQTLKNWIETLDIAISFNIPHISLYGLKIEQGSKFYKNLPKIPTLDMQAKMQKKAFEILDKNYKHYEFSNFAISDKYCSRHNINYWKCQNYYGFGLSASGYINNSRYTNTFNFKEYLNNPITKDFETLTKQNQIEEEIFLGLRLLEGIDFNLINKKYNIDIYNIYRETFDKFLDFKILEKTQNGVKLTEDAILVSNEILCEFLV